MGLPCTAPAKLRTRTDGDKGGKNRRKRGPESLILEMRSVPYADGAA
jgi:hypothetical protein